MIYLLYQFSYILLIPAFIFSMWAQLNVSRTFNSANKIRVGMTGAAAARRILDANGLSHVRIERVAGHLTDHYDPRAKVIRLSGAVYDNNTAAAVGVAAHEAGHAVQYAIGYQPIRIRTAIIPVCSFGSNAAMPIFIIGMLVSYYSYGSQAGYAIMMTGIVLFSLATLFQALTLPVEFNASRRAIEALEGSGQLARDEINDARRVLKAAALTYVAALATSLLSLLRLLLIASGGRRRD